MAIFRQLKACIRLRRTMGAFKERTIAKDLNDCEAAADDAQDNRK